MCSKLLEYIIIELQQKTTIRRMRVNKRSSRFKIQKLQNDILKSIKDNQTAKYKRYQTQFQEQSFSRCQNRQKLVPHQYRISKNHRLLEDILRKGDSSRKKHFRQKISPFKQSLLSLRLSEASKTFCTQHEKENAKESLRWSISQKPKKQIKVSYKKQKLLTSHFNKLLKEIKQKNFIRIDEHENLKLKFEAFGATLKGDRHNVNQDSMIFSEGIYIICDGHGANGKQISQFIAHTTHRFIREAMGDNKIDMEILKGIMKKTQIELDLSGIDIAFSGSTFIGIVLFYNVIFCISVGDSRAIACQGVSVKQLGVIHKPDKKTEKERIEKCGGVIHPIEIGKDKFVGPNRIWAPGKSSWGPGLALSRAFGDKASRKYGVIAEAQIIQYNACYDNNFIVTGSDGLFDFMKESQISFSIRKKLKEQLLSKQQIAEALILQAKKLAQMQSDDITCIIIFF